MTRGNVLRLGLVSAVGALMVATVGCSDGSSSPASSADASIADGAVVSDAGLPSDASTDGGATPAADAASPAATDILIDIVHAAPDVPAVGLCLAAVVAGAPQFIAPFDTVQGPLPRYAGTQLAIPAALQTAISAVAVRIYVVPGYSRSADAGAPSCAAVVGTPSAILLKEFPAGQFRPGRGYIVAATGCANSATATVSKCGADPVLTANPRSLGAWLAEFDRSPVARGEFAGQVVHLSPQTEASSVPVSVPDAGTVMLPIFAQGLKVALGTPAAQAGSYTMQTWWSGSTPLKFGASPSAKVTFVAGDAGANPNAFALGLYTAAAATPTPPPIGLVSAVPLPFVAAATLGPTNPAVPSYFSLGVAYTFFVVGDVLQSSNPQAPNAGPDFLRVLAFPNNTPPTPPPAPSADASTPDGSAPDGSPR